jgi:hypothetical protein
MELPDHTWRLREKEITAGENGDERVEVKRKGRLRKGF